VSYGLYGLKKKLKLFFGSESRPLTNIEFNELQKFITMATVTIKTTPLLLKNGNVGAILEENEYEFCPEIWDLIKEFAGIYNFAINWKAKFSAHPTFFREFMDFNYTDGSGVMPMSRVKGQECLVRRQFFNKVNKGQLKKGWFYDENGKHANFIPNKKRVYEWLDGAWGLFKLSNEFNVGDEVTFPRRDYAGDRMYRAGKICYISKDRKFYRFAEYKSVVIRNIPTNNRDEQLEMGWNTSALTYYFTIKSDKGLKKGLHNYIRTNFYN
jgi:hypothetical protein